MLMWGIATRGTYGPGVVCLVWLCFVLFRSRGVPGSQGTKGTKGNGVTRDTRGKGSKGTGVTRGTGGKGTKGTSVNRGTWCTRGPTPDQPLSPLVRRKKTRRRPDTAPSVLETACLPPDLLPCVLRSSGTCTASYQERGRRHLPGILFALKEVYGFARTRQTNAILVGDGCSGLLAGVRLLTVHPLTFRLFTEGGCFRFLTSHFSPLQFLGGLGKSIFLCPCAPAHFRGGGPWGQVGTPKSPPPGRAGWEPKISKRDPTSPPWGEYSTPVKSRMMVHSPKRAAHLLVQVRRGRGLGPRHHLRPKIKLAP